MRIFRSEVADGSILPSVFNAIQAIPETFLFHTDHGMRHPKSAYSASLRLIFSDWRKALDDLDRLHNEYVWSGKTDHISTVITAYTQLLHRINEHHDACYSVLRSICPASAAKPTQFDVQFLDRAKPAGWKQFRDATKDYRERYIGLIVNTLKHKQGELSPIYFQSSLEFRPGYYLRDVLPNGAMGPSSALHSGGNTAFSFARDMLMHLWWLFRIGDLLTTAIESALATSHQYVLNITPQCPPPSDWKDVLERCARIKPEFFPDEISKPYPRILLRASPLTFTLEFPTAARGIPLGQDMKIVCQFAIDGAHLTEKLPYMGHLPH
jgi:hypothetical protein